MKWDNVLLVSIGLHCLGGAATFRELATEEELTMAQVRGVMRRFALGYRPFFTVIDGVVRFTEVGTRFLDETALPILKMGEDALAEDDAPENVNSHEQDKP